MQKSTILVMRLFFLRGSFDSTKHERFRGEKKKNGQCKRGRLCLQLSIAFVIFYSWPSQMSRSNLAVVILLGVEINSCVDLCHYFCAGDRILEVQFSFIGLAKIKWIQPKVSYLLHSSHDTDQHQNWSQLPEESLQPDSVSSSEMAKKKRLRKLWIIGGRVFLACIDRVFFH